MSETTNAAEDTARIRAEFTVEGALAGMRLDAALAGALDAPRDRRRNYRCARGGVRPTWTAK